MEEYILKMEHITKVFPGVKALDDVTFSVKRGEIHALVGENGAGKSTLVKILSGVHPANSFEGKIILNGEEVKFNSIKDSTNQGIAIIHQELSQSDNLNIAESIFLGAEIKGKFGLIDWDTTYQKAAKYLEMVNLDIDPETKIINLGIGQKQLIEICKAISKNAKILILDEPTAALTETETENLLNFLREFQEQGVTCIYISHKLDEVLEIADSITVLRDGRSIITKDKKDISKEEMITHMVGRELTQMYPREEHHAGDTVLEIKDWSIFHPKITDKKLIDTVSFKAKRGEILGISGLMGAGRTELVMSIIGAYGSNISGELYVEGQKVQIKSPEEAINYGIGYVSEDRARYGLIQLQNIIFNTGLASFEQLTRNGLIDENELIAKTNEHVDLLDIRTPSIEQKAKNLSGGNQQKLVLAKWLMTNPKVLILDEPTRGIDVGAKVEIYNIMNNLIDQGVSIIMISSELPEVLGMSDRLLVMHEGKIAAELDCLETNQEEIMHYATGGE